MLSGINDFKANGKVLLDLRRAAPEKAQFGKGNDPVCDMRPQTKTGIQRGYPRARRK